jgi:hypothetical protein
MQGQGVYKKGKPALECYGFSFSHIEQIKILSLE